MSRSLRRVAWHAMATRRVISCPFQTPSARTNFSTRQTSRSCWKKRADLHAFNVHGGLERRKPNMSDLPHSKPSSIAHGEKEHEMVGGFTRRKVLAGAAAATAAMSAGAVDGSASAQTRQDMVAFVMLSAALAGICATNVAAGFVRAKSEPDSDPVDVKQEYFNWVNKRRPAVLRRLLQIAADSQKLPAGDRVQAIIDKVQAMPDMKYLA